VTDLSAVLCEGDFSGNLAAFEALTTHLSSGQLIGFVGAGASVPLMPAWSSVLGRLIIEAKAKGIIQATDIAYLNSQLTQSPLELATTLEAQFTKEHFRSRLADLFKLRPGDCTAVHDLIVSTGLKGFVTLNYDLGIENALAKKTGRSPHSTCHDNLYALNYWRQGTCFSQLDQPILHLHGTANDPNTIIFTGDDYHRLYITHNMTDFVTTLFKSRKLIFFGFGFSDPFLTFALEHSVRSIGSGPLHFAFIGVPTGEKVSPLQRQAFIRRYRLTPVFYPVDRVIGDGAETNRRRTTPRFSDSLPCFKGQFH
jgi:hypothetical protein